MNAAAHALTHRALSHALTGLLAAFIIGMPAHAQNRCDTQASPVNPATVQSGIGGTGAPVLGALRAWWQALVGATPGNGSAGKAGKDMVAGRPGIGGTGIGNGDTGGIGGTGIVGVIT
ncbi:MAG: hypothetical protein ACREXG_05155, partial [Polaromonas sp.]